MANLNRWLQAALLVLATLLKARADIPPSQRPSAIQKVTVPDLPAHHYRFWLRNHPVAFREFKAICQEHPTIRNHKQFKELHQKLDIESREYLRDFEYGKRVLAEICSTIHLVPDSCWGYESGCQHIYLMPECHLSPERRSRAKSVQELRSAWFNQADFGYIIKLRREMSKYCSYIKDHNTTVMSSLECLGGFKMCRGKMLMFDFRDLAQYQSPLPNDSKRQDLIKNKQVGGWNCDLQKERIKAEGVGPRGSLQSWFNELEHYDKIQEPPSEVCDETIDEQVHIVKLDSTANMYHYFCNFLNLYATFHLTNKFSDKNQIIIWDKQAPRSKFELMWKAFTGHRGKIVRHIGEFEGKRVCFGYFTLALLPRTIDGLYYNTNLVPGCSKSGLFDSFNKHVLHKLGIQQKYSLKEHLKTDNQTLRITFISRSSSLHRRILNEDKLLEAMKKKYPHYLIRMEDYAAMNFDKQLETTANSDLLIGIHGAGLTHTLFLPDWAGILEIYDCKDLCYHDLAKLRGASYFTLGSSQSAATKVRVEDPDELKRLNSSNLIDHEKFSNYRIYEPVFMETLDKAIEKVKESRWAHFEEKKNSQIGDELSQSPMEKDKKTSTNQPVHTEL